MSELTDYIKTLKVGDEFFYLNTGYSKIFITSAKVKAIWKSGTIVTEGGDKFNSEGRLKGESGFYGKEIVTPEQAQVVNERAKVARERKLLMDFIRLNLDSQTQEKLKQIVGIMDKGEA